MQIKNWYQLVEQFLFFIFQPILKSSNLMNPYYIKQNLWVTSDFVKTRIHCISKVKYVLFLVYVLQMVWHKIHSSLFTLSPCSSHWVSRFDWCSYLEPKPCDTSAFSFRCLKNAVSTYQAVVDNFQNSVMHDRIFCHQGSSINNFQIS